VFYQHVWLIFSDFENLKSLDPRHKHSGMTMFVNYFCLIWYSKKLLNLVITNQFASVMLQSEAENVSLQV